jgi:hypothetical protein
MATYRDAIDYLVNYDDADSSKEFPSTCVSMVSSLFNKSTDQVIDDVARAKYAVNVRGRELEYFVKEMQKLGFKKLKLKKGHGYRDLMKISLNYNDYTMHAELSELTTPAPGLEKYSFHISFYENGRQIRQENKSFDIACNEYSFIQISKNMQDAFKFLKSL